MSDPGEAERWREKYLRLKESEEEREAVLRRGLVCVSLAVDNVEPPLEAQLKILRERLRGTWDTPDLVQQVDSVEQLVRQLDEHRGRDRGRIRELFHALIAMLDPLKPNRKQRKQLVHFLEDIDAENLDFQHQLQGFLDLFRELVQSAQALGGREEDQPGLLRRLFGTVEKRPVAVADTVDASEISDDGEEKPQQGSEADAAALDTVYSGLRERIAEIMLGLLKQLENEFVEPVAQLQHRWQRELERDQLPALVQDTLNYHQGVSMQRVRETELFLRALSQRLVEVYRFLAGQQALRAQVENEVGVFDSTVRGEIEELRAQVQTASSLPVLKQDIELRLSGIVKLVDSYRNQAQMTGRSLHSEVQDLEARLKRMERESSRLREMVKNEHRRAMQDALTGIANRLALQDRSHLEFQRWKRYGNPLSVIMIDVDFFKKINDRFGHLAGDKALKMVAISLQAVVRQTDFLARYGGEEFVIVLPQTTLEEAVVVAEKVRESVQQSPFHFSGEPVHVTCSLGVAQLQGEDTWDTAVDRADHLLLLAKQEGRNCVRWKM